MLYKCTTRLKYKLSLMFCRSDEPLPDFEMKYIKETDIKWSLKFSVAVQDDNDKIAVSTRTGIQTTQTYLLNVIPSIS